MDNVKQKMGANGFTFSLPGRPGKPLTRKTPNGENDNGRKPNVMHAFEVHVFSLVLVFRVKRFRELATVFQRPLPRTRKTFGAFSVLPSAEDTQNVWRIFCFTFCRGHG